MSRCRRICAQIATVLPWKTTCGGQKQDWRGPNRLLVVPTGDSASQAKVFKAHAVLRGVCENLIIALKLLPIQQKDGDSPIQSIVTGFCGRCRKGIMEGLINFIVVDIHSALDVGHLKEGTRSVHQCRSHCGGQVWTAFGSC